MIVSSAPTMPKDHGKTWEVQVSDVLGNLIGAHVEMKDDSR
jgi:hypothetical protein